jgi:hypothetical protein
MKKTITVRQEHISAGIKLNCLACPIARAVAEQVPELNQPRVRDKAVSTGWSIEGNLKTYLLPRSAQRFIKRFDKGKEVLPFRFTLVI